MWKRDENGKKFIFLIPSKVVRDYPCRFAVRVERTYFWGILTRIELVASVLSKISQNRKNTAAGRSLTTFKGGLNTVWVVEFRYA
jgi:hypothetical protein